MTDRRNFLKGVGVATAMGAGLISRSALAALPESPTSSATTMEVPPEPVTGPWFKPVVTLNSWSLPWRMKNGWKEFHLTAEAVEREIAPGMVARLWGYNGQSPGPTIECVEGDKVRIFVTNRLPEHTTIHWHGIFLPAGMDGVGGLNQPQIPPGKTYAYEFELKQSGTFMYHPHADEMVQMAMGMMGSLVVHPRDPNQHRVDRDYCFLMSAYDIEPGTMSARINTMLDFNIWTWNSRPHHDQPPDTHSRTQVRGFLYRRRLGTRAGEMAGSHRRYRYRADARRRVYRRRPRRLGNALPQVAPHDEPDGARRAEHDRRRSEPRAKKPRQADARLHDHG
jgi:FtsP/CotA-like multicopper oxidase with cupredoxin domain